MQYAMLMWVEDEDGPPYLIDPFADKKELKTFEDEFYPKVNGNFIKITVVNIASPAVALREGEKIVRGRVPFLKPRVSKSWRQKPALR